MARSDYSEAGSGQWWWFTNRDYILIINRILQSDRVNYPLIWGAARVKVVVASFMQPAVDYCY